MKTSIFFFFFIFAVFSLSAQQNASTAKDSIKFEKIAHDYGNIEQGSSGECVFVFTGQGAGVIVLSSVNATCGCTTPEWPKNPVKPGEKGTIKVKYNTQIIGHFSKSITVYSNAVNSPVELKISGTVLPPK